MYWLAGHLIRRGQLEEAEALATRCVDQARRLAGEDLMVTLCTANTLVGVYIAREDPARRSRSPSASSRECAAILAANTRSP